MNCFAIRIMMFITLLLFSVPNIILYPLYFHETDDMVSIYHLFYLLLNSKMPLFRGILQSNFELFQLHHIHYVLQNGIVNYTPYA